MTGITHSRIDGHVRTITIEDEGKRNALDFREVEEMTATLQAPTTILRTGD